MQFEGMYLELYGVITKILPEGRMSLGEAIFTEKLSKGKKKFYRLLTEEDTRTNSRITYLYPKGLEEVDIAQYGSPVFLPASKNKVYDGNEYFVQFQASKNVTSGEQLYMMIRPDTFTRRDYIPKCLTVGIKFPNKFIVVMNQGRFLSVDELECWFR